MNRRPSALPSPYVSIRRTRFIPMVVFLLALGVIAGLLIGASL